MELQSLRAERVRLCAQINGLEREIRLAARERGSLWRRLYTQRLALWRRLNHVERQMVHLFAEGPARA